MSFQRDLRGFIFSLDATLAMLIVMIVMAGVARVGGPGPIYGQHGYLRLERYANDALEVLQLTGTLDSIANYTKHGYLENAENLARSELQKILPAGVQFKLVVGDNRLTVYPSDAAGWASAFSSVEELAVATRMSTFPRENLSVLAWYDTPYDADENFIDAIISCTGWEIKKTNNVDEFWTEINNHLVTWDPVLGIKRWDAVFLPDAQDLATGAIWAYMTKLVEYQVRDGRVVVGGETLYNNSQTWADGVFWESMGVSWPGGAPSSTSGQPLDNMCIIDGGNFVTAPYDNGDNVEYNENYAQYIYTTLDNRWVVAQWKERPVGVPENLPGIIVREAGYFHSSYGTLPEPAVLFNMRLAQSAMDSDNPRGTNDWITLAKRALGYEANFESMTLYVWRGEAVE